MKIWRDLNTPNAFKDDWYGELTNQIGHKWLGEHMSIWLVFGYAAWSGDIAYKWAVWGALTIGYLAVEAGVQGWKRGDSWFDALMFSTWASAPLLVFEGLRVQIETRVLWGWELVLPIAYLKANLTVYFLIFAFSWACLIPRVWRRT